MGIETARGKHITIRFDGSRCIHSRNCVLGNPKVFVPGADGEWLHPDAAGAEEIAAIVRSCPSGALTFERTYAASDTELPPEVNTVRVRENGPLAFHAECTVAGEAQPPRITLCRCGLSKRKRGATTRTRTAVSRPRANPARRSRNRSRCAPAPWTSRRRRTGR